MTNEIRNIIKQEYDAVLVDSLDLNRRLIECTWDKSELERKHKLLGSEISRTEGLLSHLQEWLNANPVDDSHLDVLNHG